MPVENASEYSVKDEIKVDIFAAGSDKVDATGIFQRVRFLWRNQEIIPVKRPYGSWFKFRQTSGFKRSATTPGRVFKGKGTPTYGFYENRQSRI